MEGQGLGFRPDVVTQYEEAMAHYLVLMIRRDSVATVEGAERFLMEHVQATGTPELTLSEDRVVRTMIRNYVGRDNRFRGGSKRIESVEVESRHGTRLTFRVRYSDDVVANTDVYGDYALEHDNSSARGGGWPAISFELAIAAEMRWKARRRSERTTGGSN